MTKEEICKKSEELKNAVNQITEENSSGVNGSYGVNRSDGVNWSYGVLNSFGVDRALFLSNKKRQCSIFGADVSEDRFDSVMKAFETKLDGWSPTFNNLKALYLAYGSDWKKVPIENAAEISKEEAWKDMPKEAIDYLKSLPEFNAGIFTEVTGIDV